MNDNNSIEVRSVSKKFDIKYTTFYGGIAKSGTKQVLDDLSFDVKKGEVLGLIGSNGSGKSTILKILSKIMYPDNGVVEVRGKIASILELGMGFESELSGRDNIVIKCGMYGLSKDEIKEHMESIIKFSELGEQIDHPLRTYSSGMKAKLAFSVLIYVKCDILVLDEVLSVGDASFNVKCKLIFDCLKKERKTVVIASHNMATIERMCDRVIWIDKGKAKEIGDAASVCYHFESNSTDSFETVSSLAETGDVTSQNRLGVMYRDGIGVCKDEVKATEWFSRASDMGFEEAQLNLANIMLKNGDKENARMLFKKASNLNNQAAIASLMSLDNESEIISKRLAKRVREEAESGNSRAMKLLADMLYNGTSILKDWAEAYKWYLKCAELGIVQSQYTVAVCNRDGIGTAKNSECAIKWFTIASNNGNSRARIELATMYRKGIGIKADMKKAIEWYVIAADCGDTNAMFLLGTIYRDGIGVDVNQTLSEYWLSRFSKQGRLATEVAFGDILKQGKGPYQDEHIFWYTDAAKEGNAAAAFNLGLCYRDGTQNFVESKKAYQWFKIAASQKHAAALYELGNLYYRGSGTSCNKSESLECFKQSAHMGFKQAMFQYGYLCLKDESNINVQKFYEMMTQLSEFGDNNARALLLEVMNNDKKS